MVRINLWNMVRGTIKDNKIPITRQYKSFIVFLVIILLLIAPINYIANFLSFQYPIEYRETASIYPAIALNKGINPYSLLDFPEHIYVYGILYPLTLAPIINLANHPLLIARAYNVLFLIAFLWMSFLIFRKRNASVISASIGVLMLLNSSCYIWTINGVRPDTPALFFAFLGLCFLLKEKPTSVDIFLCAISCVISFYFKQYFLFSALVATAFLYFCVSKQKGYLFIAATIILGLVSFSVIRSIFPLYYEYSILHHINMSGNSTAYMENESISFLRYYWVMCLLYLFYLYKTVSAFGLRKFKEIRLMPFGLKEPFIPCTSIDIFGMGMILSVVILTFWLGKHNGNTYTYYGELLLPFLLYVIIPGIDKLFKIDLHRALIHLLILAFCVFPFQVNYSTDYTSWNEAFSTLSQYAERCDNLYDETPLVALYKIEHNIFPLYNNGQIEYAQTVIPNREVISGRISVIPTEYLNQRLLEWNNSIESSIQKRAFDCIFSENEREIKDYKQIAKVENVLGRTIYIRVSREP